MLIWIVIVFCYFVPRGMVVQGSPQALLGNNAISPFIIGGAELAQEPLP